jgi:hypothetical protein
MPAGISKHDENVLKNVKRRAYYLELFFGMCGFNVGWTVVIGIIPLYDLGVSMVIFSNSRVGVAINLYLGYCTIQKAEQIEGGLTAWQRSRMMANMGAEAAIGITPIIGDIGAAVYKSNTRNAILLENILKERGEKNFKKHHEQFTVEEPSTATTAATAIAKDAPPTKKKKFFF